jgi:hypothetical protein
VATPLSVRVPWKVCVGAAAAAGSAKASLVTVPVAPPLVDSQQPGEELGGVARDVERGNTGDRREASGSADGAITDITLNSASPRPNQTPELSRSDARTTHDQRKLNDHFRKDNGF